MKRCVVWALTLALYGAGSLAAGEKGTDVDLGGAKATAPGVWKLKEGAPAFKTRLYTFTLAKAKGDEADAELQIIFFGKGSGGGEKENIARWQGMFEAPEGKDLKDLTKIDRFKVGGVPVVTVDIQGTYLDKFPPFAPTAKTIRRPNYRRINVIFDHDNGPFFMILVGPAKTVESHHKEFEGWLKAFK